MKFCPRCNREFEDRTVFCPDDGSPLRAKPTKIASPPTPSRGSAVPRAPAVSRAPASSRSPAAPVSALAVANATDATTTLPTRSATSAVSSENFVTDRPPAPAPSSVTTDRELPLPPDEATSLHRALPDHMAPTNDDENFLVDSPTVAIQTQGEPDPEPSEPEEPDMTGRTLAGRYKINKRLGEGGMGVVYAAVDDRIDKQVAIKVLKEEFSKRSDVVARFTQEAKSAGRIKHENVLDVTDYGRTEDGWFYIAMELLAGTDLADVLEREGTVGFERGVDIAVQICRALAAAHKEGVVHRDLKPENVFLVRSSDGREVVKIVDFGIAQLKDGTGDGKKLTRTGMIFGTPEYMSPEQASGKPIDHRVDVYAVGIILYEMFAGRVPFTGDTFMGVLTKHMFEPPPPMREVNPELNLPADLETIVLKSLAKKPEDRYASMIELAEDLNRFRSGARISAQLPTNGAGPLDPTGQRLSNVVTAGGALPPGSGIARTIETDIPGSGRKRAVVVGVIALLVVAGGVGAMVLSGDTPPTPRPAVNTSAQVNAPPNTPPNNTVPANNGSGTGNPQNVVPTPVGARNPPPPAVDAGPAMITVRINTRGASGARVEGHAGEATQTLFECTTLPCEQRVPSGAPLRLIATAGRRRGTLTVTPTREGEVLEVELAGASSSSQHGSNTQTNGHTRPGQPRCGFQDPVTGLLHPCFN